MPGAGKKHKKITVVWLDFSKILKKMEANNINGVTAVYQ
jgi:hypothetical protein